jgi:hypothetical protein
MRLHRLLTFALIITLPLTGMWGCADEDGDGDNSETTGDGDGDGDGDGSSGDGDGSTGDGDGDGDGSTGDGDGSTGDGDGDGDGSTGDGDGDGDGSAGDGDGSTGDGDGDGDGGTGDGDGDGDGDADGTFLFAAPPTTGDIADGGDARVAADNICAATKASDYPELNCSTTHALIGIGVDDEIQDMVANYGLPNAQAVLGPTGIEIGASWADLFDGSLSHSLGDAAVFDSQTFYWTGSKDDGSGYPATTACAGFSYGGSDDVQVATLGDSDATNGDWLNGSGSLCNVQHAFVCACW